MANVVTLTNDAISSQELVEQHLRKNSSLFSKEERELLLEVNEALTIVQSEMEQAYSLGNMAGALSKYADVKFYYATAIEIIESKLSQFPIKARLDIARQIRTVKDIDKNITLLIQDNAKQEATLKAVISVLSVVGRVVVATL